MAKLLHRLNRVKWDAHRPAILSSGTISNRLSKALNAHRNGDYDTAISIIQKIPEWEKDPTANRVLGHALLGLERFDEALEAHHTAQKLRAVEDPGRIEDEVNIASVHVGQKNYVEALDVLEGVLNQEPGYVPAILGQIAILNRQERDEELKVLLTDITRDQPSIWSDETVKRFLNTDTDLLKIRRMVAQITHLEDLI